MTKTLLIVNPKQYGFHSDTFEIANKLSSKGWIVTYLCIDQRQTKIEPENGINVVYVSCDNKFKRLLSFLYHAFLLARKNTYKHVVYFKFCLPLSFWNQVILDIRTMSVDARRHRRRLNDKIIYLESLLFKKIVAISEDVSAKLPKNNRVKVIGLAADVLAENHKNFDELSLFYIGTLENRCLENTIDGLKLFIQNNPNTAGKLKYYIAGAGTGNEENKIHQAIKRHQLENNVVMLGYLPKSDSKRYFEICNIGVSFVPITEYYQGQPPTKTYEYIKSGLFTIATATSANCKIITSENGFIIKDNASSFADGLDFVFKNRCKINSTKIRESLSNVNWSGIADEFEEFYYE